MHACDRPPCRVRFHQRAIEPAVRNAVSRGRDANGLPDRIACRAGRAEFLARDATLVGPIGIVVDKAGYVYVSECDWTYAAIVRIDPKGMLTTFAGTTVPGFTGDGGPATAAQLYCPIGLAFEADGRTGLRRPRQQPDPSGRHRRDHHDDRRERRSGWARHGFLQGRRRPGERGDAPGAVRGGCRRVWATCTSATVTTTGSARSIRTGSSARSRATAGPDLSSATASWATRPASSVPLGITVDRARRRRLRRRRQQAHPR